MPSVPSSSTTPMTPSLPSFAQPTISSSGRATPTTGQPRSSSINAVADFFESRSPRSASGSPSNSPSSSRRPSAASSSGTGPGRVLTPRIASMTSPGGGRSSGSGSGSARRGVVAAGTSPSPGRKGVDVGSPAGSTSSGRKRFVGLGIIEPGHSSDKSGVAGVPRRASETAATTAASSSANTRPPPRHRPSLPAPSASTPPPARPTRPNGTPSLIPRHTASSRSLTPPTGRTTSAQPPSPHAVTTPPRPSAFEVKSRKASADSPSPPPIPPPKPLVSPAISVSQPTPERPHPPSLLERASLDALSEAGPSKPPRPVSSSSGTENPGSRRTSYHVSRSSVDSPVTERRRSTEGRRSAEIRRSIDGSSPNLHRQNAIGHRRQSSTNSVPSTFAVADPTVAIPETVILDEENESELADQLESTDRLYDLSQSPHLPVSPRASFSSVPRRSSASKSRTSPRIDIPPRGSSASSSPSGSFSKGAGTPPDISPRRSSMNTYDQMRFSYPSTAEAWSGDGDEAAARRASKSVNLGEPLLSRPAHGSADLADLIEAEKAQRSSPHGSPRPDRKSPGLTIRTPPQPAFMSKDPFPARPSPPIPAKSPLRRLSSQNANRAPTPKTAASGDSMIVHPPTPLSAIPTRSRQSSSNTSTANPSPISAGSEPSRTIPFPPLPQPLTRRSDTNAVKTEEEAEEIRFTMMTVPSVYSQDSAPNSAQTNASGGTLMTPVNTQGEFESEQAGRNGTRDGMRRSVDISWGRRGSRQEEGNGPGSPRQVRRSSSVPRLKPLPSTPVDDAPRTASTNTSTAAVQLHTPTTGSGEHHPPTRSPSLPVIFKQQLSPLSATGRSNGQAPLLPSVLLRSPTAPDLSPASPRQVSASSTTSIRSKRAHLLHEIAATERAYANDLALLCDAYIGPYLRPASQVSSGTGMDSASPSGGGLTESSGRSSVYTYQTAETKRSSGYGDAPPILPSPKSPPAESFIITGGTMTHPPSSYFSTPPSISSQTTPQPSPRNSSRTSVNLSLTSAGMAPPVGKPLSPQDVRAVFLNLEQVAAAAEDMAKGFERALGDVDAGEAAAQGGGKPGEVGEDRLGKVFVDMLPTLRPLYNFYCARQSLASLRMLELQSDPLLKQHLDERWSTIKDRTHAWNLDSMLIKPVQRITKYPLLFDDLLGCTTPVHPDYFSIRAAAEGSRTLAMEIDETKRRKDMVANIISPQTKLGSNSPIKGKADKGKGLKLFNRKEKSSSSPSIVSLSMPPSTSTSTVDLGSTALQSMASAGPAEIPQSSIARFQDLVARFEEAEQVVRRVGKEIVTWTAAAKEVWVVGDGVLRSWERVYGLGGLYEKDGKVEAGRVVIDGIVAGVWTALNDEVRYKLLPIFTKLLEASTNPRKVIQRRDARLADYTRYHASLKSRKPITDRVLVQSASDFVALHHQLVEELPVFLEQFTRILDLAIGGFAAAQAKYLRDVRAQWEGFSKGQWMKGRRGSRELLSNENGRGGRDRESPDGGKEDLSGRAIVKVWHDAWLPYSEAMEHFQITRPARQASSRIAAFNAQPGAHPATPPSAVPSPQLRHSASMSGGTSSRPTSPSPFLGRSDSKTRNRSSSNLDRSNPPIIIASPSTASTSRFGLLRRSNSRTSIERPASPLGVGKRSKPVSMAGKEENRLSFGLPKFSADPSKPMFEGLGLSPTKSTKSVTPSTLRMTSDLPADEEIDQTKFSPEVDAERDFRAQVRRGRAEDPPKEEKHPFAVIDASRDSLVDDRNLGLGFGQIDRLPAAASSHSTSSQLREEPVRTNGTDVSARRETAQQQQEIDASEGWRNERVIYQCACVADFDPDAMGNKRYRGLRFLRVTSGDLIDVFYEVGRIDELPSFPYPEVGVDNDGVLIGRAEDGSIGLAICSFLEPLRE